MGAAAAANLAKAAHLAKDNAAGLPAMLVPFVTIEDKVTPTRGTKS
ncbi:MAG: hypothetical protein ACFBZ9_16930 [Sphingomonadales bacterium]